MRVAWLAPTRRPSAAAPPAYKEPPPDSFKEVGQWKTAKPLADYPRGAWWEIFGDAQLNALEELTAFKEVEDNLASLRLLETEAQQQNQAVLDSRRAVELFTHRYEGGADPYLDVVTAQTTELANERNAVEIQRRRMEASVSLVKAVGGGWDASNLPPISSLR